MIDSKNIKVGILIPTFNRKAYLEKALNSACEQTYDNIEIIVIDNGSNTETAEFMAGICDPRVRYIVNEQNIGMIGSINKGIKLFSDDVEWCTILGDDDLLDKNSIASMITFIFNKSVKSIAHCHRIFINGAGRKLRDAHSAPMMESAFEYLVSRYRRRRETFLTGVYFSRQAFEKIGGYPSFTTGMATDDAFIFALSINDGLFFNNDASVYVRFHMQAESWQRSEAINRLKTLEEFAEYAKHIVARIGQYGRNEESKIEKALKRYVKRLNGALLLGNVNALHGKQDQNSINELLQLYAVVKNKNYDFSSYLRFRIFCVKYFNFSPNTSKLYRFLHKLLADAATKGG